MSGGTVISQMRVGWTKLTAHGVVKGALVYLGLAFAFSQGVEFLHDVLGWSDTLPRLTLAAVALMLPCALTISYFQVHLKRDRISRVEALLLFCFLLGGAAALWYVSGYLARRAVAAIPDIALRFANPQNPTLMIENSSGAIVSDVVWMPFLWDIDHAGPDKFIMVRSGATVTQGWLQPHQLSLGMQISAVFFEAAQVKKGDRIYGVVTAGCMKCARGRAYILALRWGESGWYYEETGRRRGGLYLLHPTGLTNAALEQFAQTVDASVPKSSRIAMLAN